MKIMSWNIRGLGKGIKVRELGKLIKGHKIEMLLLQESKKEEVTDQLMQRVWYDEEYEFRFSPSMGKSEGLIVCWKKDKFQVITTEIEIYAILLHGRLTENNEECVIINVYGPCDKAERLILWDKIRDWSRMFKMPWCLGGDFNDVRNAEERKGCKELYRNFDVFNQFIDDLGVLEPPLTGKKFTWFGAGNKCCRLDRFLVSNEWMNWYRDLTQIGLMKNVSDHVPVVLQAMEIQGGPRPFKFLSCWLENKD